MSHYHIHDCRAILTHHNTCYAECVKTPSPETVDSSESKWCSDVGLRIKTWRYYNTRI